MNIWLLIWVFAVVFIFGIFVWSMQILFKQKKAWADFAKKNTLQYTPGALMKSPSVNGLYKGYPLSVFSEEQPTPDQRGRRFRSVLQFELPSGMPTEGVVASGEGHGFANSLTDLTHVIVPEIPGFPQTVLIRTSNHEELKPYLTDERYKSLQALMTIKSISAVFIFDRSATFLRFETSDPLADSGKLERLCAKIAEHAKVLSLA